MILAMNTHETRAESEQYLARRYRVEDRQLRTWYDNYRPLGACSAYIWNEIRLHTDGRIDDMLDFIDIVPVPLIESLGTVTGKYPAKDKITSSAVDLLGRSRSSGCSTSATPTTPTASICGAAPWPGWRAAASTSATRSTRTRRTWSRSTSASSRTGRSR